MIDGELELVERAIGGDSSAFGVLYDEYQPKIYRFVLLKVGHREDAEDITHHVFLNAWKGIGQYKDQGNPFSSWLYQIARNLVADHYRSRKEHVSLDEVSTSWFSESGGMELRIDLTLELKRVGKALQTLSQDSQDVVIMRLVEGMSVREVAEILDKSESAVKVAQHRALKELKKMLGNGK